jgi:hypothetical protein
MEGVLTMTVAEMVAKPGMETSFCSCFRSLEGMCQKLCSIRREFPSSSDNNVRLLADLRNHFFLGC